MKEKNKEDKEKGFVKQLNGLMQFPEEGIFSTVLAKGKSYNHTLMCLSKGSSIEEHTSTKSGVVYVLKGKGKFKLFEKEIKMEPGTFIFMPADAPHSLEAEEDLGILVLLNG